MTDSIAALYKLREDVENLPLHPHKRKVVHAWISEAIENAEYKLQPATSPERCSLLILQLYGAFYSDLMLAERKQIAETIRTLEWANAHSEVVKPEYVAKVAASAETLVSTLRSRLGRNPTQDPDFLVEELRARLARG